jgi:hypothetical protein
MPPPERVIPDKRRKAEERHAREELTDANSQSGTEDDE